MIIILCGQIEGAEEWEDVPSWPLNPAASTDEQNLEALADWLGLDERGYSDLKFEALRLTSTAATRCCTPRSAGCWATARIGPACSPASNSSQEESRWSTCARGRDDRTTPPGRVRGRHLHQRDRPGEGHRRARSEVSALRAWIGTNKVVPLHWNHSSEPEDIVGHVKPASAKAVGAEVHAAGHVDLDTDRGRQVWRLMKAGSIGFSFGYLVPEGGAKARPGGGRRITQLDVFEITVTPGPMNPETRVLATKALDEHAAMKARFRDEMYALLTAEPEPVATKSVRPPVQVASFDC